MNWGTKIFILYLAFVGLIVALIVTCFGNKTELEYTDYYKRELNFQEQITAGNNANALSVPIDYTISGKRMVLRIPEEIISSELEGSIQFLRPSDSSLDKTVVLAIDSFGQQQIDLSNFTNGAYKMSILCGDSHKKYYKEAVISVH